MTTVFELTQYLDAWASFALQESYDNAGLLVGDPAQPITGILVALDCTEAVVEEAIQKGCNVVVAHHPIVFKGLKRLTGRTYIERTVLKAIKNDVAIVATHTNLDHVQTGVNAKLAALLGLKNTQILSPKTQLLLKLTFFVPVADTQRVLDALYAAGAGQVGQYDRCSFRTAGTGTFRGSADSNPTIGQPLVEEEVAENRVEVILPDYQKRAVLNALHTAHPYEEVAYYVERTENAWDEVGAGMIGALPEPFSPEAFLALVKTSLRAEVVKYTPLNDRMIQKVAVCGGAGGFLLPEALAQKADAFITSDYKYHEFFDGEGRLMICDVGHYESEVATKELILDYLSKKYSNFALCLAETNTNPVRYFF